MEGKGGNPNPTCRVQLTFSLASNLKLIFQAVQAVEKIPLSV